MKTTKMTENIHWTDDEINLLKKCRALGMTYKECSTVLKRSVKAIGSKANRIDMDKCKKWTQKDILLLVRCLNSNMTYAECAEKLNRTQLAVKEVIHRLKNQGLLKIKKIVEYSGTAKVVQMENRGRTKSVVHRFGRDISKEELKAMSEEEKTEACLNCTLPECINCFGAGREGKR